VAPVLHYLFTGDVVPRAISWRCGAGRQEAGQDVGCGPARLHNEKETQDFARFLETFDEAVHQVGVNYREMSALRAFDATGGKVGQRV
jgi:hypothetical protein